MSWNGTVRCSVCGKEGHNRRSCPTLKERLAKAQAIPEGERGYYDREIIREFEQKKRDAKLRACSYCGEKGHNRRTCKILAKHQANLQKQQVAFRTAFLQHVQEIGLNVGTIVDYNKAGARIRGCSIVTEMVWDNVSITRAHEAITRFAFARPIREMTNPRARECFTLAAPDHWPTGAKWTADDHRWQEQQYGLKVLSPVDVAAEPPSDWLTCEKEVKEFFKERASWMWASDDKTSYYSCDFWNLEEKEQELEKIA